MRARFTAQLLSAPLPSLNALHLSLTSKSDICSYYIVQHSPTMYMSLN